MKRLLCALLVLASLSGEAWSQTVKPDRRRTNDMNVQLQKFSQFYRNLANTYIDTLDNPKVIEDAIKDILAELDPHSSYISPEEMVEVNESFEGKFSGIGVQINSLNDTLRVVGVISGGPSEKVGVIPNDRIIKVDDRSIVGLPQTECVKLLRGPKGSQVTIEVVRVGEAGTLDFRIKRDDIALETIDAAYMASPGVGYIRVNRFAHTTMKEFRDAFAKMNNPGALILDLRSNGGGLLNQAIDMANFFLPQGAVIVSTEGRAVPDIEYDATSQGTYLKGKVVVLIDDFSASASEIVAGALQDWDRAVVIGHRSFGKGLVQRQYPLIDGSAVNITIARYLTPTGRAIQRPFEKGKGDDYYEAFAGRLSKGYIDTLDQSEELRYKTLRLGKDVYGGGGIYPDYYIPYDTAGSSSYLSALVRQGVIYEYSNVYMDTHRAELLGEYSDVKDFMARFEVSPQMISQLTELGGQREVALDAAGLETSRNAIDERLEMYIARSLWGESAAYQVANQDDDVMKKALEVIGDWNTMARGIATDTINAAAVADRR